jgi:hypothetical protein
MPGDFRFHGIWQTKLLQTDTRSPPGESIRLDRGEKPIEYNLLDLLPSEGIAQCPSYHRAAPARKREGDLLPIGIGKEVFLSHTAEMTEGVPPLSIKTPPFGESRFYMPSEGDVDVVATEKKVISHRHPFELELSFPCSHRNEAQVRGPATDVAH